MKEARRTEGEVQARHREAIAAIRCVAMVVRGEIWVDWRVSRRAQKGRHFLPRQEIAGRWRLTHTGINEFPSALAPSPFFTLETSNTALSSMAKSTFSNTQDPVSLLRDLTFDRILNQGRNFCSFRLSHAVSCHSVMGSHSDSFYHSLTRSITLHSLALTHSLTLHSPALYLRFLRHTH